MRLPRVHRRDLASRLRIGRRTTVGVAAVLAVVIGVGVWLLTRGSEQAAAQSIDYTVSRGTVQQTVTATGTLAAAKEADLDFSVSGKVTKVWAKAGDKVHQGQKLARIDDASLRAAYAAAQSQLSAAQTQYDDDSGAGSTQLASDSAAITSARAALDQASDDLDAATLRSTITGTIASVDVAVGDQVAGSSGGSDGGSGGGSGDGSSDGSGSGSGTTYQVVVVAPGHFLVDASVSGSDVASLKKGMQAQVTPTDATQPIFGTVTSVGLVAQTSSSGAATFPVEVQVTGVQKGLYVGTSVNVSIITKQRTNVLTVPALALRTSNGSTYVEKVVGGKTVQTKVTVGDTYSGQTEITSGLKSGDKIELATGLPARINRSGSGNGNRGGLGETFQLPGGASGFRGGGNAPPVVVQGGP